MGRDQRHLRHVVILAEEISIHSPRMGRDAPSKSPVNAANEFQSTLPAWGETAQTGAFTAQFCISIHSPRMGRDSPGHPRRICGGISIHSPRMGRDLVYCKYTASMANFNPLSPHGERLRARFGQGVGVYFNPLSPHGERLLNAVHQLSLSVISIHSPRMGRDAPPPPSRSSATISIHSPRMGRDQSCRQSGYAEAISIHSPRMGRDRSCLPRCRGPSNFNPLSPHGERL